MLLELHLRNLGVIARAKVAFAPGLNVVTGETGVGKTLLISSLALVTGARAGARLVSPGADETSVEAIVSPDDVLRAHLTTLGTEAGEEVVLSRRVSADGKTRAWVDGRLVPVAVLAEVGELLVELLGQGTGFALARPSTQLASVDALAGNDDIVADYRVSRERLRALVEERGRLEADDRLRAREAELLAFQADEIARASLQPDEEEQIAAELVRLEHAEQFAEIAAIVTGLAGAEGAAGMLAEAHKTMLAVSSLDADAASLVSKLGAVAAEAAESAWGVRAWGEGLESDPARLSMLRERKALIGSLKRKYGSTVEAVVAAGADALARLATLEDATRRALSIAADEAEARKATEGYAAQLSARRARAAKKLTKLVAAELPALALAKATFEVALEHTDELTERGRDRVSFLFSAAHPHPAEPIGKVASGGELSRAMIAVTLALARSHAVPVLVFDEADQGVGGEAALDLARRLARLGETHQVLVVSHLPQIAAFADRHIVVRKTSDGVEVDAVEEDDRLAEISRMLAGLETSELARAHAGELVDLARGERSERPTRRAGTVGQALL